MKRVPPSTLRSTFSGQNFAGVENPQAQPQDFSAQYSLTTLSAKPSIHHKGKRLTSKNEIVARIEHQLDAAAHVRARLAADPQGQSARESLRTWQSDRLARTHSDLLESPRYAATATFFLREIYGPKDLSRHEEDVRRLLPLMKKALPEPGLETIADAIELNALSESLDADMVAALGTKAFELSEADYVAAYGAIGRRPERERQIALIAHLGVSLDKLTRKPFIGAALSMMRKPAMLAGLGELQNFLERGYDAFRTMKGAGEFLDKITSRETALLNEWFGNEASLNASR
jgi:hypothetical protein